MDFKKKSVLNIDLLSIAQETLISVLTTLLYGKETSILRIDMKIISDWFQSQKNTHPKVKYGVLYQRIDTSSEMPRLYQGAFDEKWNCLTARQIVSDQIDEEVKKVFGEEDLVVFDSSILPEAKH